MSWIVRIAPSAVVDDDTSSSGSLLDSLLPSVLWDLGTTGLAEVDGGIIAGFDRRAQAERAVQHLGRSTGYELRIDPVSASHNDADPGSGQPSSAHPVSINWAPDPIELQLISDRVFGHGRHPTTQLALDLLLGHLAGRTTSPDFPKVTILDVGTGTGVLAIAAAKTGLADVTAIDIDGRARSTASHNAELNGVNVTISDAETEALVNQGHRFDVAVANVLLAQHRELANPIVRALDTTAASLVVVSGYLVGQADDVFDAYVQSGFTTTVLAAAYRGQWAGHLLRVTGGR